MRTSLVASVLGLGLAGACYRGGPPPSPRPAPAAESPAARVARYARDPLAFLPREAEVVAHLDVGQLRQSPLWQQIEPVVRARVETWLAPFRAACGFDPLATIRQIAIGIRRLDAAQPTGVIVVRGLERATLMGCVERATRHRPVRATIADGIVTVPGQGGAHATALGFADATTLVILTDAAASAAGLRAVLDAGAPLWRSPAFTDVFATLPPERPAWFVVRGNVRAFASGILGHQPHAAFGALELANGLDATVRIRLDTPAAAQQLAASMQGQLGAVQGLVTRFDVTADDRDLVISIALSPDQVTMLVSLFGLSTFGGP